MTMTDDTEQENISSMSAERAGEMLARMTKEWHAAEAARAAGLTPSEPPRPTDADGNPIPQPASDLFVSPEERDASRWAEARDHLEANGFPMRDTPVGDDLWNMIEGRSPVSPELQAQAEKKLASFLNDADWRARLERKEERAVREFHLATGIIAAGKIQREQGK
jgi:hypothetical protein